MTSRISRTFVVLALLVTAAVTAAPQLDENEPAGQIALPPGVRVIHDVTYGPDRAQRFDVYIPRNGHAAPVIFMVHGGAWSFGDKSAQGVVENKLAHWAPKRYIFISVDYRMLPAADALEQARDVARALAAAQRRAGEWGGDPAKFILMGHSAGAHLVALVASSRSIATAAGVAPWKGTVILDSAALDVFEIMNGAHFRFYDRAFGSDPAEWRQVSPLQAMTGAQPPALVVCSSRRVDSCPAAARFVGKASTFGTRATLLEENLSHMQINKDLGANPTYTAAVDSFLASLWSADVSSARR